MPNEDKKPSGPEKLINAGVSLKLKHFSEEITVRDLPLESVILLSSDLGALFESVESPGEEGSGLAYFAALVASPPAFSALKKIAAAATELPPGSFDRMGITDWLKLFEAIKSVVDWDELRAVFFRLAGSYLTDSSTGLLAKMRPSKTPQVPK